MPRGHGPNRAELFMMPLLNHSLRFYPDFLFGLIIIDSLLCEFHAGLTFREIEILRHSTVWRLLSSERAKPILKAKGGRGGVSALNAI